VFKLVEIVQSVVSGVVIIAVVYILFK